MCAPVIRHSLLWLAPLLCGAVAAQELTLFEPVESAPAQPQPTQPQMVVNQNGQPAFTVRGTARVGDVYRVSLANREGVVSQVQWRAGEQATLPGLQGYVVVDVKPRSVTLLQPPSDPCVEAPAMGVTCNGAGQALLAFATAAPLPPPVEQPRLGQGGVVGIFPANGAPPQNPFEAAIQAQQAGPGFISRQGPNGEVVITDSFGGQQVPPEVQAARDRARAARAGQFQPQRIPDDQIPEGMRRVSTPFGDRLIQVRE